MHGQPHIKFKIHICSYNQQMACVYGNQVIRLQVPISYCP